MRTITETDSSDRRVVAMSEWADLLVRGAHDALERMDHTLTLTEAKIAIVRELISQRHRQPWASESGA